MSRSARVVTALLGLAISQATLAEGGPGGGAGGRDDEGGVTRTPIRHLVVIFQENVSFDHYFATYPVAANPPGEPPFHARRGTPSVDGLGDSLLAPHNPNAVQPFRLSRSQFQTADQDHGYRHEQQAYDAGLMDLFVEKVGRGNGPGGEPGGQVMGYYDGNTVTALWNYAQAYAMSDDSFSTTFGPSTPGALNLVSGQTHGFARTSGAVTANGTIVGDPQPTGDLCSSRDTTTSIDPANLNVGDLLERKGITWGWFQGGFRDCTAAHANKAGVVSKDYIPHHQPFQYFATTANPGHLPPTSVEMVGRTDQANHQYDLADFWAAVEAGNLPAVSFLKAPAYQDGHAGYSDPLDEQEFLVETINRLQDSPFWEDLAVVIAYDDSDGWYDHVAGPVVNQSQDLALDAIAPTGCGGRADPRRTLGGFQDRCGYGPRQPLLVVSRYARVNYVDHTVSDQSSILRFIEDNWETGRIGNSSFDEKAGSLLGMFDFGPDGPRAGKLHLDPATGLRR